MPTLNFDFNGITNGLELNVGQPEFPKLAGSSPNTITVNSGALDFTSPASNNLPATYAYETSATDHEFSVTYAATGKSGSFITCCIAIVDYRNMLGARLSASTTLELVSLVNSTPTTLATTTITRTANDVVRVTRVGTLVTVYVNDVQKLQVTTSAHSTGTKVGFCCRSSTVAGVITAASVITAPPITVTSVNGGNPITAGQTGVASVSTGFTGLPVAIATDASGVTCSNIGGTTNAATFDISDRVNAGLYPKSGASVNFTFTNGGESAVGAQTVVKKSTETTVAVSSPIFSVNTLANAILAQTGRTIATGDDLYYIPYDDLVITPDTDFTVTSAGTFDMWLWVSSGADVGKNYYYAVTITDSAVIIVPGISSVALTSAGLSSVGLTSTSL